jgi:HlyD family secretion protein
LQGYVEFTPSRTIAIVPESAITHLSGGEGMVAIAKADRVTIRKVKLGRTRDNQREVIEGLKPGERVIANPRALKPGDRLKTLPQKE